jgi:hypothetical protein
MSNIAFSQEKSRDKAGWIRLHRGEALDLLLRHPKAFALLSLIAKRARYKPGRDLISGVELQVGEALTGRGDMVLISSTPKEYRVAKDQLIKWGFMATSKATSGATWGTVVKLTNTCPYEVIPFLEGQEKGKMEGHHGATLGPPEGHEQRTKDNKELKTTTGKHNSDAGRTLKYLDNLGKEEDPQSPWLDS